MTKMWFWVGFVFLCDGASLYAGGGADLDERDALFKKSPSAPLSPLRPGEGGMAQIASSDDDDCCTSCCTWCCLNTGILRVLECFGCITLTTRDGTPLESK